MKLKMINFKIKTQKYLKDSKNILKFFGIIFSLLVFIIINFSVLSSTAFAAVGINNEINFQGKLVNSSGLDVSDGSYTVVFSLYNVSSGGTAIWTETDSVTTTAGIFQVQLGANTSLPGNVNFNSSNLYLGIKVGTDAEMTPRIQFTAVPYAFNASALDGVVATQSATGFNLQGGTSSQSTLQVTTSGNILTFQPGVAEGLTVESNGANGLTLDTGGNAAVDIGNNNATSFVFGKGSNNPTFNFNNGTGGFTVGGTGSVTLSALNTADGLVYTTGTNGVLSQTAPNGGLECLQSNSNNTSLAWGTCAQGTNEWQQITGAISPTTITDDMLLGGTSTTSARFAFINNIGSGVPTASISAENGANNTYLTGAGVLGTTNGQSLTLGSISTGNIQFYNANNTITSGGNLTLAGSTGIDLSGTSADINFTGTGAPNTITTSGNDAFAIMPNGTGGVGINTTSPLASLDMRNNLGTIPTASISGKTSAAELVVDQSGSGDILTASASGATQFSISNNGTLELNTNSYAACGALSTTVAGIVSCSPGGSSDNLGIIYAITAPAGSNLTINFNGAANAIPASSSGTITFPANTEKLLVEVKGAGGGGGGVGGATSVVKDAGGGGEGGYSTDLISTIANNYYVKVGGGGIQGTATGTTGGPGTQTCLGTNSTDACNSPIVNATGGLGGTGTSVVGMVAGGAAGVGAGGNSNLTGQPGFNSSTVANAAWGGAGGGTGGAPSVTASGNGTNGINGGGGSGGGNTAANATDRTGGYGGNGYIVFYIYTNATSASPQSDNWYQYNSGVLVPLNLTSDVVIGGASTASAAFAFMNVATGTPIASISAENGANATYMTGAGTLGTTNGQSLTLGSSGNVQFYNSNNTLTSAGNLTLAGATGLTLTGGGAGIGFSGNGTDVISTATNSNLALMPGGAGEIGVNVSSNLLATMDIRGNNATTAVASVSGATNFVDMIVNNNGTGDLLTASKSGATKFTVLNNGNLQANNYNTNGGVLYTTGTSGVIAQTAAGTGLQCLLGGTTPSWGNCALGTNEWQQITGAISPTTITDDMLLGGNSTTSARFAFINDVGAGTPTASISANNGANATFITGAGVMGTTNGQTLTLGSGSTGNILINSPSLLSLNTTNNAAITTGNGLTTLGGGLTIDGPTVNVGNGSAATLQTSSNNANLTLTANGSGSIQLTTTYQSGIEIGGGIGNPKAPLYINGGIGNNGALIVNNNNSGDIIDASASGQTKFQVANSGAITASGAIAGLTGLTSSGAITLSSLNTALGLLYTSGTNGVVSQTAPSGGSQCLQSNGTDSGLQWVSCSGVGTNFWQLNNGALSPFSTTADLLLGSTATTSASFAVTGIAAGLTPIASISATSGNKNGISLNASTSTIQSQNNNSLILGGITTGNIQLADNVIQLTGGAPILTAGANILALQGAGGGNIQFFNNASDILTSAGNLSLAGSTGITLSGGGAGIGFTGTGADSISTQNNSNLALMPGGSGEVGVNASSGLLATMDIRGNNATTAVASVSGKSSFAAFVVNNSGTGDLFTASSAGATKFTIKNSGSVVFGGNDTTISASGSGATNNGSGAVENDLQDEGSLIPNANFDAFNNLGGFADDWVASSTNSATVARDTTTTPAEGNASAKVTTSGTGQVAAFYSACVPLALTNSLGTAGPGNYDLSYYVRLNNAAVLATVRAYVDGYTSEANCNNNNAAITSTPVSTSTLGANTTWDVVNTTPGVAFTGTPANLSWGRIHFFVADGATGAQVNIDGVRLIESVGAEGLDYAEDYPADPNNISQPGQVVSLEESSANTYVAPSHVLMDNNVIGVISTNPGYVLNDGSMTNPVPVALAGRVPVNVSTANGPIQVGDYLTASTIPGVAVKATGSGQVIGTAMEDDSDTNTSGVTQITMFIKNTYYNGGVSSSDSGLSLISGGQDPSVLLSLVQDVVDASGSAVTSLTSGQVSEGLTQMVLAAESHVASSGSTVQEWIASSSATENSASYSGGILSLNGLTVSNFATDSGDLRVEGNGLIEGVLHIVDTLFANDFIANGVSDFFGNVIFHSGVTFNNTPEFNSDTAGIAIIKKGADHVDVKFTTPYDQTPMVNASITVNQITPSPEETQNEIQQQQNEIEQTLLADNIHFVITNKSANGFTILLSDPANEDIAFSWLAIEVQNPVIFQSDEQSQPSSFPTTVISPTPLDTVTLTPTDTASTSALQ